LRQLTQIHTRGKSALVSRTIKRRGKLMAYRESDYLIILRDGNADHMGKGIAEICSL
jgi:hypothetical protein